MKKLLLFAAPLLAAMPAGPALAQDQIQLILNFDGPQLGEQLTEIGATWEKQAGDNGAPFYAVKFANGLNAVAFPTVCNGEQPFTGCTGLRLWANFSKPEEKDAATVARAVNEFNLGHVATMASYSENGEAQINMYLIADYGIAIANMKTQLQVFEASAANFSQALYNAQ